MVVAGQSEVVVGAPHGGRVEELLDVGGTRRCVPAVMEPQTVSHSPHYLVFAVSDGVFMITPHAQQHLDHSMYLCVHI